MQTYKNLDVWNKSIKLVTEIYKTTAKFPKKEQYGLISQLQRAAISIPSNIAEGWGRGTTKEYIQFLLITRGSLMELETHLIISQNLNYISKETSQFFINEANNIGMMLNRLIQKLKIKVLPASRNPNHGTR